MPLLLVGAALILDGMFRVVAHQSDLTRAEIFAIVGVRELLDENTLQDRPTDQSDDIRRAHAEILASVAEHNHDVSEELQIALTDLSFTAGRVLDVTQPPAGANFIAESPLNAMLVKIHRSGDTGHPLDLVIGGFGVTARSAAALDSRLVGFMPQPDRPAPVVPLAILASAWNDQRVNAGRDSFPPGGNGRLELELFLADFGDAAWSANAVLIGFSGAEVIFADVRRQVVHGIEATDVPGGRLGPATPDSAFVLKARQTTASAAQTNALVADFTAVAGKTRVFPLYGAMSGKSAKLVGFVGATVLAARNAGGADAHRLAVTVEPAFIIHSTAWTDPAAAENRYVHRIRIAR